MNYIAETIMKTYEARFPDDDAYLAEKKAELSQHDSKWQSIAYLESLDGGGRNTVCDFLGISRDDLEALIRIYSKL